MSEYRVAHGDSETLVLADAHMEQVHIVVEEYAQVIIVHDGARAPHLKHVTVTAHKESSVHYYVVMHQANVLELNLIMQGRASSAVVRGMYALHDAQKIELSTHQIHAAPHTRTDLMIKGVLADAAHAYYHGTITIAQQAQVSQAEQYHANLMLSKKASVSSKPTLQVHANDVRCKHASAIGQLNEEHLFYLQSRGYSRTQARAMVVHGFLATLLPDCYAHLYNPLIDRCVAKL